MIAVVTTSTYNCNDDSASELYQRAIKELFPHTNPVLTTEVKNMYYNLLHHFTHDSKQVSGMIDGMSDAQLVFYLGNPYDASFGKKSQSLLFKGRTEELNKQADEQLADVNKQTKRIISVYCKQGTNLLNILPKKPTDVIPDCDKTHVDAIEKYLNAKHYSNYSKRTTDLSLKLTLQQLEAVLLNCVSVERILFVEETGSFLVVAKEMTWKFDIDPVTGHVKGTYEYDDLCLDLDDGFLQRCDDPKSDPPFSGKNVPELFKKAFTVWNAKWKKSIVDPIFDRYGPVKQ